MAEQDFYNEFSLWSSAPNRKNHIPYVLKILLSPDKKLQEDMMCRNDGWTLTEKALEESKNNIGIHGPFSSFDEMMEDINAKF